jgi:hypothetical protein
VVELLNVLPLLTAPVTLNWPPAPLSIAPLTMPPEAATVPVLIRPPVTDPLVFRTPAFEIAPPVDANVPALLIVAPAALVMALARNVLPLVVLMPTAAAELLVSVVIPV